eukprot:TRINITY_DN2734_c0_g1_i1.p1 TRINITY_DN2734_c0_g1~~TRINITY_DN2734_c0_g1_i1.p1  ORF type:complete len:233 (-),score=41.71 TRINITY_DN2734_c0_g1_i1:167-865(-)
MSSEQQLPKELNLTLDLKDLVSLVEKNLKNKKDKEKHIIGNPGALGLGGFALTTFILSVYNAGVFIPKESEGMVLPLALFYGGLAQFVAGVLEFNCANTFAGTAFCSYGAFWLSFAAYVKYVLPDMDASLHGGATGLYLLSWTIFSTYMTVASIRVSKALTIVFVLLVPALILLTAGAFSGVTQVTQAGGFIGIGCALVAWYNSASIVINTQWNKEILPVGHGGFFNRDPRV